MSSIRVDKSFVHSSGLSFFSNRKPELASEKSFLQGFNVSGIYTSSSMLKTVLSDKQ